VGQYGEKFVAQACGAISLFIIRRPKGGIRQKLGGSYLLKRNHAGFWKSSDVFSIF
jgi:hypothetical protein